jgi:hypothetical protein
MFSLLPTYACRWRALLGTSYAHDSTLYIAIADQSLSNIQSEFQLDLLLKIQEWCSLNNMAINPEKTTCMIIVSKCKINNIGNLSLHFENSSINNVHRQKLLVLHIDNCLSWKTHIDKTCSQLASKISLLKGIQIFLTSKMKQLFYNLIMDVLHGPNVTNQTWIEEPNYKKETP